MTAIVREINGELVLDDPDALACIQAVERSNCRFTYEAQIDRVDHFARRCAERKLTAQDVVIVLLDVDDENGKALADILLPNYDWDAIRARGEKPFARGLAMRAGIQIVLDQIDKEASEKLKSTSQLATVVVQRGVAEVFEYGVLFSGKRNVLFK
jgi:hypothetical protein